MGEYRESGGRLGGIGGAHEGGCCNRTRSCVARHPAAAPEAERGAGEGSRGLAQPCRSHNRARPAPWQPRRHRRAGRPGMGGRGGGDRRRGEGLLRGRQGDVLGHWRLCRICGERLRTRQSHAGRPELRAGRDAAGGADYAAQCPGHGWTPARTRQRDDPGGKLGRRPHGPADRQAPGGGAGDRHLDQCGAARPAQGIRR